MAAPCLRCAGVVGAGRRLLSKRFPRCGVNCHHPYWLLTRMITAVLFPAAMWDGLPLDGLEQAELAGAGDGRGAVLNAEFAIQGALVSFHGVE